ncbi:MAG: FHA domain-containing protein [Colwellia sp.]|nr:FHA domain-containing protein [Colwellia sp.]
MNTKTKQSITLRNPHVFGRSPISSNTLLNDTNASRVHSSIHWNSSYWLLQDSSTNGSFINKTRVTKSIMKRLKQGDTLNFGDLNSETWQLIDDSEPKSMLIPLDKDSASIELTNVFVLPNENAPEVTFYLSPEYRWLCESKTGTVVLNSGDNIQTSTGDWYFVGNYPVDETCFVNHFHQDESLTIKAEFTVSQNEEHVYISLTIEDKIIDLGRKSHHYLVLVLARKWQEDKINNIQNSERGWLDKALLCKELIITEQYMNIQIYRFRKQVASFMSEATILPQPIKRRFGEIRITFDDVNIIGGAIL